MITMSNFEFFKILFTTFFCQAQLVRLCVCRLSWLTRKFRLVLSDNQEDGMPSSPAMYIDRYLFIYIIVNCLLRYSFGTLPFVMGRCSSHFSEPNEWKVEQTGSFCISHTFGRSGNNATVFCRSPGWKMAIRKLRRFFEKEEERKKKQQPLAEAGEICLAAWVQLRGMPGVD